MPTQPKTVVCLEDKKIRLDVYMSNYMKDLSRVYVQELISKGYITVNQKRVFKGFCVTKGDCIQIGSFLLPTERRIESNFETPLKILQEFDDYLVVDKQAGIPTHPNQYEDQSTLANALIAHYPEIDGVGEDHLRPGIVHRLDTDTSGILLVARTQPMFEFFRTQFDQRKIKKTYLALVLGQVKKAGEISFPIAHHLRNPRKMVAIIPGKNVSHRSTIRQAHTLYEPLKSFKDYTLLEVKTLTGRMHQVRVHLSSMGHSLAGDGLYQSGAEKQKDTLNLKRHFLHACCLTLTTPNQQTMCFKSPLPQELQQVIEILE